jgi:3-polyprenyl-4-hydroxybenzoate decarboxylase
MLGEGQVSLTKVMIVVDSNIDVQNFDAVSEALWRNLRTEEGIHLLSPTAQDTLDFTGPAMNTGSRLILIATACERKPFRENRPASPPNRIESCPDIKKMKSWGPCFLIVQLEEGADFEKIREILAQNPVTKKYLFHVMVSPDVLIHDKKLMLWGWFTRFDPLNDLYPAKRVVKGNRLIFDFPIAIDARWKKGYPDPLEFDPDVKKHVDEQWSRYKL